jgi:two-component system phosphate regulon sensor histidine kinase PhoR
VDALAWTFAVIAALVAIGALAGLLAVRRRMLEAAARAERERSRADAAERRASDAFQALPIVALRVASDGRILEANGRARDRFRFLDPGMSVLEAFSEHELANRVSQAVATSTAASFEVRLFAEGRRTYRVAVEPYHGEGGAEALVALTDTSEAVAYQELRSQFVANVSHELRTPLTGLRGLLEALDDPEMDEETRGRFVERATRETARLEALIGDILFLSELEATQGLPSSARCDLSRSVEITIDELSPLAFEHAVRVESDARPGAWTPLTDRMARTVVRNLIENAIKYAGAGARATVRVAAADDTVTLTVEDDGTGIAERHLPHVFERFYRADPSRSKRLGGTGLGLSIVKHIAERFGGRATVAAREGFGTTITVELPRVAAAEDPEEEAEAPVTDEPARSH